MASAPPQAPTRHGSCLCGAVTYTLTGKSLSSAVCHCANCQKFTGSALAANAMYTQEQLKLHSGKDALVGFLDAAVDSGNVLKRSFCGRCGSSLFLQSTNSKTKNIVGVMTGALDGDRAAHFQPKHEYYPNRRYDCVSVKRGVGKL